MRGGKANVQGRSGRRETEKNDSLPSMGGTTLPEFKDGYKEKPR